MNILKYTLTLQLVLVLSIFLLPNTASAIVSSVLVQEDGSTKAYEIRGKVLNSKKEPVSGALITIAGTSIQTNSDEDGNYVIRVDKGDVLNVTLDGYKQSNAIYTGKQDVIDITLLLASEVVVKTPLNTYQLHKDLSTQSTNYEVVKREEILAFQTTNLTTVLKGLNISGFFINEDQSTQGGGDFILNGVSTISQGTNTQPLVFIDGVRSNINDINAYVVEEIKVLKSGPALALYGSEAANGVLIITSIIGAGDGLETLEFNVSHRITEVNHRKEVLNGVEYANYVNQLLDKDFYNANAINQIRNQSNPNLYSNTNWEDELYNLGNQTNFNANYYGGFPNMKMGITVNYDKYNGQLKDDNGRKIDFNFAIESTFFDFINLKTNYLFSDTQYNTNSFSDITNNAAFASPLFPVRYNFSSNFSLYNSSNESFVNPLAVVANGDLGQFNTDRNRLGVDLKFKVLPNLFVTTRGYLNQRRIDDNSVFNNTETYTQSDGRTETNNGLDTFILVDKNTFTEIASENYINYDLDLTEDYSLKLSALGGYAYYFTKYEDLGTLARNFSSSTSLTMKTASSFDITRPQINVETNKTSYFANLSVSLLDILGLSYSYRNDSFEKLNLKSDNNTNHSAGVTIDLAKMFFEKSEWMNTFNLRSNYSFLGLVNNNFYTDNFSSDLAYRVTRYEGASGFEPTNATNFSSGPDRIKISEAGFDTSLFNDALKLDFTYYEKVGRSTTQLIDNATGPLNNASFVNVRSSLKNRGVYGSVSYKKALTDDLNIGSRISFTYNNSTIEEVKGLTATRNSYVGNPINYSRTGYAYGEILGLEYEGVLTQNDIDNNLLRYPNATDLKVGNPKFKDQNGDNIIDDKDVVSLGNVQPTTILGFQQSIEYKKIKLSVFAQAHLDRTIYVQPNFDPSRNNYGHWAHAWTPSKPNASLPSLNASSIGYNSSLHTYDASFVNISNLNLSYPFDIKDISLEVYGGINNLYTFAIGDNKNKEGFESISPLQSLSDSANYTSSQPSLRTYFIGLNVKL